MIYNKDIAALERKECEAAAELQKQQEQMLETKRKLRAAKSRLLATTRSDKWHAMALSVEARRKGFTGEHAEALFYLRSLPVSKYLEAINLYISDPASDSVLDGEYAAVEANMLEWTELGKHKHWDRARREYEGEVEGFRKWQAANPDKTAWRDKPATTDQYFLIWRTAEHLEIEQPRNLKCGDAHDWLAKHDANLRFRLPGASSSVAKEDISSSPAESGNLVSIDPINGQQTEEELERSNG